MAGRWSKCGFTLIELLVVIIIIAVMAGVVVPAYSRLSARIRFDSTVADIQDIFGYAREAALTHDTVVTLTYDPQSETFVASLTPEPPITDLPVATMTDNGGESGLAGAGSAPLPGTEGVQRVMLSSEYAIGNFTVQNAAVGNQNGGQRTIRFNGDGTSDGAELVLASREGDMARLRLSPATGRLALISQDGRSSNP